MTVVKSATSVRRLGRGLGSLISPAPVEITIPRERYEPPAEPRADFPAARGTAEAAAAADAVRMIRVQDIEPNPRQPRTVIDEKNLDALAESIRADGLMQPIIVRPRLSGGYQLVAGERRWRAAQRIGLQRLPAVVRDIDERAAAEWALIENIQREDLNAMDRAEAFQSLARDFGLEHQEIAARVGLDRSTVTNLLRLNELDEASRAAIRSGRLTMGHAKALLSITNLSARAAALGRAMREEWSVRALEQHARAAAGSHAKEPEGRSAPLLAGRSAHLAGLERQLGEHLGTRVRIHSGRKKGAGRMSIDFYSLDQFEGLMQRLGFKMS